MSHTCVSEIVYNRQVYQKCINIICYFFLTSIKFFHTVICCSSKLLKYVQKMCTVKIIQCFFINNIGTRVHDMETIIYNSRKKLTKFNFQINNKYELIQSDDVPIKIILYEKICSYSCQMPFKYYIFILYQKNKMFLWQELKYQVFFCLLIFTKYALNL